MKKRLRLFLQHRTDTLRRWWSKNVRSYQQFQFNNRMYTYNDDDYNFSYANERSVEIPIFQQILTTTKKGANILEVGNVLSHYQRVSHDIIDKYEKGKGVINKDVSTFKSTNTYDLIISISTLEHVGWDEDKKDSSKIQKSLTNLRSMLKIDGELWVSVPLGYNPFLDQQIKENSFPFTQVFFLKRMSGFTNTWKQIENIEIGKVSYNAPYPQANVVVIAKYRYTSRHG